MSHWLFRPICWLSRHPITHSGAFDVCLRCGQTWFVRGERKP